MRKQVQQDTKRGLQVEERLIRDSIPSLPDDKERELRFGERLIKYRSRFLPVVEMTRMEGDKWREG